jgi:Tfp pilus assembly protein PilN
MAILDTSLGIDFKATHLVLTFLRKSMGKVRLVDYGVYPLFLGGQKEVQEAQWISFITDFISKHQIRRDQVFISIPREKVILRFLRFPAATKENLRKVLEYEAARYTPFEKEELCFDYQILQEDPDGIELVVVYVKKEEINLYLSTLKKIGIEPFAIQIPSIAALNLFFYHQGDKSREIAILLDMSSPFFEMNILRGRKWEESFNLLSSPDENKEETILEVLRKAGWSGEAMSRAAFFVYGLDAARGSLPSLRDNDPLQIVNAPPLHRIEVARGETRPDYIYPSIGLALMGLVKPRFGLNLLPPEMRRRARQTLKYLALSLAGVSLFLMIAGLYGTIRGYQNELRSLQQEIRMRKPMVDQTLAMRREAQELQKEVDEFSKIMMGEVSKIEILKELTEILPPSAYIWNLRYTGKEIEISGFADSASDLIPLIDKSPLFEKVEFSAPVTKERERRTGVEKERERFKIKMRLEGRKAGAP